MKRRRTALEVRQSISKDKGWPRPFMGWVEGYGPCVFSAWRQLADGSLEWAAYFGRYAFGPDGYRCVRHGMTEGQARSHAYLEDGPLGLAAATRASIGKAKRLGWLNLPELRAQHARALREAGAHRPFA